MSDYDVVPRTGSLKLKKIADHGIKKKKKKRSNESDQSSSGGGASGSGGGSSASGQQSQQSKSEVDIDAAIEAKIAERNTLLNKTKHELRYYQNTQQMQEKRVMEKASKTHKMRVEEFNRHLDNLTEHFDIPKVSWTK